MFDKVVRLNLIGKDLEVTERIGKSIFLTARLRTFKIGIDLSLLMSHLNQIAGKGINE